MPVFQLTERILFPPPGLAEKSGLLAVGGDLRPERILAAYRRGIFPWYSEGDPLLWWCTSPRLVLFPNELIISKRLARKIRQQPFEVSFDRDFKQVITSCAAKRTEQGEETWIVPEMQAAFIELHRMGYGHSVECWQGPTLVGGLYGLRLGGVFFGESMFTRVTDASKIAFVHLVGQLKAKGVQLVDCQMTTQHLLRFGAREIPGKKFQQLLDRLIQSIQPDGTWTNE